jgi:hypothetical protein
MVMPTQPLMSFQVRRLASRNHQKRTLHTTIQMTLNFDAGPLVWIDCEMTGLNPKKQRIWKLLFVSSTCLTSCGTHTVMFVTLDCAGPDNERKPRPCRWRRPIRHTDRETDLGMFSYIASSLSLVFMLLFIISAIRRTAWTNGAPSNTPRYGSHFVPWTIQWWI